VSRLDPEQQAKLFEEFSRLGGSDAFILQLRFLRARYYLRFPDLRDSDASTLRTSDWEIPNRLAIRVGVIPALKVARTALTWPGVNATFGSSGCRRSGDSSVVVE
jgi:hypothetical protein